jgi:hypothetical protein
MVRFLLYTALVLNFSALAVSAEDRYGEWLLEQPRSSVLTLSFKQSVTLNDKTGTSELGFICDQRDKLKSVGVVLIPFDGTFENKRGRIPVLIQKRDDQFDSSDLSQKWQTATQFIFAESEVDVEELASFIRANETNGVKSVHFFFPNDLDTGPQISNHVAVNVSGFSEGFGAFKTACAPPQ